MHGPALAGFSARIERKSRWRFECTFQKAGSIRSVVAHPQQYAQPHPRHLSREINLSPYEK